MRAVLLSLAFLAAQGGEEVPGIGRTLKDAEYDARQHALERLQARLDSADPPRTSWRPTLVEMEAFIRGPGKQVAEKDLPYGMYKWNLTVEFPSEGEIERRDQQAWRQRASAIVCAALVAGCGIWVAACAWRMYSSRGV